MHTLYRHFFWDYLWWHPLTQRRSRRTLFLSLSYTGSKKTQCLSTHLGSKSGPSQRAWRCVQVFYLSGKTSKCAFMSTLFKTMLLPMHSKVGDCSILTRLEVDLILTCFYLTIFLVVFCNKKSSENLPFSIPIYYVDIFKKYIPWRPCRRQGLRLLLSLGITVFSLARFLRR